MINTLNIDIETYSSYDIKKTGVYKYVEAPDFAILIFAYSVNGGPVSILDLASDAAQEIPQDIIEAIFDESVTKYAFNATFERVCISEHIKNYAPFGKVLSDKYLNPRGWRCTMVDATRLGLPASLGKAAEVLQLSSQKDTAGTALINFFSKPCKATKANGKRTRNLPEHDLEKWEAFMHYCGTDVETELAIKEYVEKYLHIGSDSDSFEQELYWLDQRVNDKGVRIDPELMKKAMGMWDEYVDNLVAEAKRITNVENVNSDAQVKAWLAEEGYEVSSLAKEPLAKLLNEDLPAHVKKVLLNRQEWGKTSTKKYNAMENAVCSDGRVRGTLQFYGASRTGRWAGRLIQVQNLPQNKINDIEVAREAVLTGDTAWVEMLFDKVPFVLSQLIRTALVPTEGKIFAVSDFSAIEARVIAWIAGEQWRLDVFKTHGKIYEASASQMFHVPIESIGKGSPLRQKGKVAELALGYQGGAGALIQMGALDMGLTEEELPEIVQAWRHSNPAVTKLWKDLENAAKEALVAPGKIVKLQFGIEIYKRGHFLMIKLPSGRHLAYPKANIEKHPTFENSKQITYWGLASQSRKWSKLNTYGGKLTENVIQAIARDCLAETMIRLDKKGYEPPVFHVHDEVVMEQESDSIRAIERIMTEPIDWAPGLPLEADGFETAFYRKD